LTELPSKNVDVYAIDGSKKGSIAVPKVFSSKINASLIKRAVQSIETAEKQPQSRKKRAGRFVALYRGRRSLPMYERTINTDRARLPRKKNRRGLLGGDVANITQAVSGPRAHALKLAKKWHEQINKKEKKAALKSAIASSTNLEWVKDRHQLEAVELVLPFVVENKFEELKQTKDVVEALKAMKLYSDLVDAKSKRRRRAGRGTTRGRKYKQKKSLLIVTGETANVYKASRNLPGVDICPVQKLNTRDLAPGAKPGRLVVWSENAIKALETW
jgi:large subunit ribosomal protein L4e